MFVDRVRRWMWELRCHLGLALVFEGHGLDGKLAGLYITIVSLCL